MKIPNLEKIKKVQKASQAIGEFLDWLSTKEIELAKYDDKRYRLHPIHTGTERLLMEYYKIDPQEVEKERQSLLDQIRADNSKKEAIKA